MLSVWSSHRELIARADHYLERVALAPSASAQVASLPHGDKRKLEVAILLALEPAMMMFDEPTAGMSVDEVPVVLDLIAQGQGGAQQDGAAGRAQDGRGARAWPTASWCCTTAPWWPTANRPP